MLARFKTLWESISTSLWFVPGLMTLGAVLLAWLALSVSIDPLAGRGTKWLHSGSADEAASLLSVLLTSMITMATLAISITMVVLALAANQLGPRLIRNFMADKRTQFMLGFFLATIVYLVLVLRVVNDGTRDGSVPHLAVTLGSASVLVCVFLLLLFVHHLARSIVADTIIQRVGRDLDAAIETMLPEAEGSSASSHVCRPQAEGGAILRVAQGGYVQALDYAGLVDFARKADVVLELNFRPGHLLLPEGEHGRVHPASAYGEELQARITDFVVLGSQRTATQDLEFAIRQLVEVALRALSPGVNDPFTAIAAIDRLGLSLVRVMRRGTAEGIWCDEDGIVRVTGKTTSFKGIIDAAFNQIRQSGGQPAILIQLLATLGLLAEHVRHEEHRRVLAEHVGVVAAAGKRSIAEPYDLKDLEERSLRARARLGGN